MVQDIYIIDNEYYLYERLKEIFKGEDDYRFITIEEQEIETALRSIPSLIIIHEDSLNNSILDICSKIRNDEDNSITPIIVISSNTNHEHNIETLKLFVEYYIKKPLDEEYLYYTIVNILRLIYINRAVSPLTGLQGNVQIQAEMKKRLMSGKKFVMLYLDLDNFKAYNDVYGFIKGDEMIKFTAKTIAKNVHEIDEKNGFVGHIGGDDFIVIITNDRFEELCQNIILDFDYNVLDFYTQQHIEMGYIEVENRKGDIEQFPLTSISIGVVIVDGNFHNILEIGEVGAQVKRLSKSIQGSTYVVNKRRML